MYICVHFMIPIKSDIGAVTLDSFRGNVLREVVRFLKFKKDIAEGVCSTEFEVDKDLAVDVLLAASYLQIE